MDAPELSPKLLDAGHEYLSSLDRLGLNVEGLMWVYDFKDKSFLLWLVWSGVEKYGPFDIQQKLFQAYNASALPKEVDPFIVHVLSPRSSMANNLRNMYGDKNLTAFQFSEHVNNLSTEITPAFEGRPAWTYRFKRKNQTPVEQSKYWAKFEKSVLALAS